MAQQFAMDTNLVRLGDPAPWFNGRNLAGAPQDLHVDAGRWVIVSFLHDADQPRGREELQALLAHIGASSDDRLAAYCVVTSPPAGGADFAAAAHPALRFVADYDGRITRLYGAEEMPRTLVLDPLLRTIAIIPWDHPAGHAGVLGHLIASLPAVDQSAGVPLSAPLLIVPRILDFDLCDLLVGVYDKMGGQDSGFLLDRDGRTSTVIDHSLKRRRDLPIVVPELRERIRGQIVRRLLPAIERFFQFSATRMDRYLVSCYDSGEGGHFCRHRDNLNAGAAHRRFAVSINLNGDYEGCDLVLPEFGRRVYRAPVGGAMVFSCGALHEVTPITRGRRYAFLPFLYGEADAALRQSNNARLDASSARYSGDDLLYPQLESDAAD
jgi:predicted 2-oxoglutarate/Fe(II)-dependent dioxygenase YbiX/peroxiredoxin